MHPPFAPLAIATLALGACTRTEPSTRPPRAGATVQVFEEGIGMDGRRVLTNDAEGTLVAETVTDAKGTARVGVPAGGSVTVAYGVSSFALYTFADLAEGDVVSVGEAEVEHDVGEAGTARITSPSLPPGAVSWAASLGRDYTAPLGASAPVELQIARSFLRADGTFAALAEARDDAGRAVAFASVDVGLTDALAAKLGPWRTDFRPVTVRPTALPKTARMLALDAKLRAGEASFPVGGVERAVDGVASDLPLKVPRGLGSELEIHLDIVTASMGHAGLVTHIPDAPDVIDVDGTRDLLPDALEPVVEPTADPDRPRVHVAFSREPAGADCVVVRVASADDAHVWYVVMAAKQGAQVRLPQLPPSLRAWIPREGRTIGVAAFDLRGVGDYRALVHRGIDELGEAGPLRYATSRHFPPP